MNTQSFSHELLPRVAGFLQRLLRPASPGIKVGGPPWSSVRGERCRAIVVPLLCLSAAFAPRVLEAQTPLANGAAERATLALNTTNRYTFNATNGESILIRMGAPFRPLITLHAPNGTLVQAASGSGSSSLDALIQVTAATNGTFRVEASSYYRNASGDFLLNLAKAPGEFIVSPGDDGGPMINGGAHWGELERGDMDLWSVEAAVGDSISLRMGTPDVPGYRPLIYVYSPTGRLVGTGAGGGSGDIDAFVSLRATNSGVFTVVVQSYYYNNSGAYTLHLAKAPGLFTVWPGDEGGPLTSGALHPGVIDLGDLDVWSFQANAGENILLRMGAPEFRPYLQLYGPGGVLIVSAAGPTSADTDASISIVTTNSGVFTVVAHSYYANRSGPYALTYVRTAGDSVVSPEDEGGWLINGLANVATNSLGDIDVWTFNAVNGESLALRVGAPAFRPSLALYGPNGGLLATAGGVSADRDASLFLTATNSGKYTAVVQSFYSSDFGSYTLHLAQIPGTFEISGGDEGGTLAGGVSRDGIIALGDQDPWQFGVCRGERIVLRCEKTAGATFNPRIRLFGRNGALLSTGTHATAAVIQFNATNSGVYTVLVDGAALNHSGSYRLTGNGIADGLSLCVPQVRGPEALLGGVGGHPGATFVLFTQTNVDAPAALWMPLVTNRFDVHGVFSVTNAFNASELQRYFWLIENPAGL